MARALDLASFKESLLQRSLVVRAKIVNGIEITVDVTDGYCLIFNLIDLCCSWRNVADFAYLHEWHCSPSV
jgi:hypothetical protein